MAQVAEISSQNAGLLQREGVHKLKGNSPSALKKNGRPTHQRVFSQMNLKDVPDMVLEEEFLRRSQKKRKAPYEEIYDSPEKIGFKSLKKKMSPMKRFQKHPNEVGFQGKVCTNRPTVSHSNFQLHHVGEALRGHEHFRTNYFNHFEDRFVESLGSQPHIVKTLDYSNGGLSPLAQKGKIVVTKKSHKSPSPRLGKSMEGEALPEVRYGTSRMNVLNHTIAHGKDWDRVQSQAGMLSPRGRESALSGTVSVWAGIPVTGDYTKVFNRQKTFQSEWQSACFHGGVFKDPLHYHASP